MFVSGTSNVSSLQNMSYSLSSRMGITSVQTSSESLETSRQLNQRGKLTTAQKNHVEKMLKWGEEMFPSTPNVGDKQFKRDQQRADNAARRVRRHVDSYATGYLMPGSGDCVTMRNMTKGPRMIMVRNICKKGELFNARFSSQCGGEGVSRLDSAVIFYDVGHSNCSKPESLKVTSSEKLKKCAHASYLGGGENKTEEQKLTVTAQNNCTIQIRAQPKLLSCKFNSKNMPPHSNLTLLMKNEDCAKKTPVNFVALNNEFILRSSPKPTSETILEKTFCVNTNPTGYGDLIVENNCGKLINFGFNDPSKCGLSGIINLPSNEKAEVQIINHECYNEREFLVLDAKNCQPIN